MSEHVFERRYQAAAPITLSGNMFGLDPNTTALSNYILKTGGTTTTASIPFAQGLNIPINKKLWVGDSNTSLSVFPGGSYPNGPPGDAFVINAGGSSYPNLRFDTSLGYITFRAGSYQIDMTPSGGINIDLDDNLVIRQALTGTPTFLNLDPDLNTLAFTLLATSIRHTNTSAFLVEDAAGTDVFNVNTSTGKVSIPTGNEFLIADLTADRIAYSDGSKEIKSATVLSPLAFSSGTLSLGTVDISANTNLAVTSPIILTGDTLSFDSAANFIWTGTQEFNTSDRQVIFGDGTANDFTLTFDQANDATLRWDNADKTFYWQLAGATEYNYPAYLAGVSITTVGAAGDNRYALQSWGQLSGGGAGSAGGFWGGYRDSGTGFGTTEIYGGSFFNMFESTTARTFSVIYGQFIGSQFAVGSNVTATNIYGLMAYSLYAGDIVSATNLIAAELFDGGAGVGAITNSFGLRVNKMSSGTSNREIQLLDAGGAYFRDANQVVYSRAGSTITVSAATTGELRIGATPATSGAGSLITLWNASGLSIGATSSAIAALEIPAYLNSKKLLASMTGSADMGVGGTWGGLTISATNTRGTTSGAGTGISSTLVTSQPNSNHTAYAASVTAASQTTGTVRILNGTATMSTGSATTGQAQGGFLQLSSPSAGAAAGYLLGIARGATAVATNPNSLDLLGIGITYLSNDTTGIAYGLQMLKGATVPSTAYMLHGFGHVHTIDDNTWDLGTGTSNKFRNLYLGTSARITSGNASALIVEEAGGTDRFVVDTSTPKIDLLANTNLGVSASTGYNLDLHTASSGKGVYWRPAATSGNYVFSYSGKDGHDAHVLVEADLTSSVSQYVLTKVDLDLTYTGGKSIAIPISVDVTDTRTINASGAAFDYVRCLDFRINRSSSWSTNQTATTYLQGIYLNLNNAGNYNNTSAATANQYQDFGFYIETAIAPTFSGTQAVDFRYVLFDAATAANPVAAGAGSNTAAKTITMKWFDLGGSILATGGAAFHNMAFTGFDVSTQLLAIGGTSTAYVFNARPTYNFIAPSSAVGIGYRYAPTVTNAPTTHFAMLATASGIGLASDGAGPYSSTGGGGGFIALGAGYDFNLWYEADDEAVFNIPTGAVYDWRINNADILSLAAAALTFSDAVNVVFNATTGTKLGTNTTGKIGVYGATPIAQRAGAAQAAIAGTAATNSSPWGYSTQAQADAIVTLANELRAWAVAQGWIKGSA